MTEDSLRDRSKARRRAAIERAALRLFAAQGYEATTVAQIAAEAEVSPRTVSLYFPAKIDLALGHVNASADRLTEALGRRVASERLLEVFDRWLEREQELADPEFAALREAAFAANPSLRALRTVEIDAALEAATRAIAAELGLPPEHHSVRIARGAAVGVLDEISAAVAAGADPPRVRGTAMTFLRAGFAAVAQLGDSTRG